jgi:hypothetical protein
MSKLNTLVGELATIALEKRELANKEEVIKSALLVEMHKENLTKVPSEVGTASITTRKSYTFTDAVKKLDEKLKIKKDEEIKKGLATVTESQFVTFRVTNE